MFVHSEAQFSDCQQYRYKLIRRWDENSPHVLFVMLNPSTADENVNDPTVRRCVRYAMEWGYGGLMVGNLFALRSTDPAALYHHDDPIGPGNDDALQEMGNDAGLIIAAWSNHGKFQERADSVAEMFSGKLNVLKLNKTGAPAHPLYLPKSAVPTFWQ